MSHEAPAAPQRTRWRLIWQAFYYAAILVAIIVLHMRGGLATPPFIYVGF